ncbi:MAG: hypothetical protein COV74_07435 [Candidatus Omnitrophica bacterium CG11_big_fil_rev_8_21_14_0_20_45_26]|uniref:PqqD family protein n=1 Tax=Candidatus Abzuiibacterium crystallinum TaxID=1974748 RepID=A0A2H0LMX7_9BACT|nr:MAG: hypothetical protein COV74_07435 [Candidatus Omnitrophica bacterium CG11_big_fil_rev_8_21_14_0_20_45_26]PIW64221.1 MAG: hypothetical protein COW12_07115 [Candidatus Omnitrophica bacterium CG12_big_fil_rev_8_21_14_0_65_45_16]
MLPPKPKGKSHIVFQPAQEGCLLLNQKTDQMHSLNAAAAFIWTFCDGRHSIQDIEEAFLKHAKLPPEEAKKEIDKTLAELHSLGLLE